MIRIGSVVTVVFENTFLVGKQGEVIDITHEGIEVKFGENIRYLFDYPRPEILSVIFKTAHLREDIDWTIENKLEYHFRGSYFRYGLLKDPLNPHELCMCEGCSNLCEHRILVNIWGTVLEQDVCTEHKEAFHGKRMDEFPGRVKTSQKVPA